MQNPCSSIHEGSDENYLPEEQENTSAFTVLCAAEREHRAISSLLMSSLTPTFTNNVMNGESDRHLLMEPHQIMQSSSVFLSRSSSTSTPLRAVARTLPGERERHQDSSGDAVPRSVTPIMMCSPLCSAEHTASIPSTPSSSCPSMQGEHSSPPLLPVSAEVWTSEKSVSPLPSAPAENTVGVTAQDLTTLTTRDTSHNASSGTSTPISPHYSVVGRTHDRVHSIEMTSLEWRNGKEKTEEINRGPQESTSTDGTPHSLGDLYMHSHPPRVRQSSADEEVKVQASCTFSGSGPHESTPAPTTQATALLMRHAASSSPPSSLSSLLLPLLSSLQRQIPIITVKSVEKDRKEKRENKGVFSSGASEPARPSSVPSAPSLSSSHVVDSAPEKFGAELHKEEEENKEGQKNGSVKPKRNEAMPGESGSDSTGNGAEVGDAKFHEGELAQESKSSVLVLASELRRGEEADDAIFMASKRKSSSIANSPPLSAHGVALQFLNSASVPLSQAISESPHVVETWDSFHEGEKEEKKQVLRGVGKEKEEVSQALRSQQQVPSCRSSSLPRLSSAPPHPASTNSRGGSSAAPTSSSKKRRMDKKRLQTVTTHEKVFGVESADGILPTTTNAPSPRRWRAPTSPPHIMDVLHTKITSPTTTISHASGDPHHEEEKREKQHRKGVAVGANHDTLMTTVHTYAHMILADHSLPSLSPTENTQRQGRSGMGWHPFPTSSAKYVPSRREFVWERGEMTLAKNAERWFKDSDASDASCMYGHLLQRSSTPKSVEPHGNCGRRQREWNAATCADLLSHAHRRSLCSSCSSVSSTPSSSAFEGASERELENAAKTCKRKRWKHQSECRHYTNGDDSWMASTEDSFTSRGGRKPTYTILRWREEKVFSSSSSFSSSHSSHLSTHHENGQKVVELANEWKGTISSVLHRSKEEEGKGEEEEGKSNREKGRSEKGTEEKTRMTCGDPFSFTSSLVCCSSSCKKDPVTRGSTERSKGMKVWSATRRYLFFGWLFSSCTRKKHCVLFPSTKPNPALQKEREELYEYSACTYHAPLIPFTTKLSSNVQPFP